MRRTYITAACAGCRDKRRTPLQTTPYFSEYGICFRIQMINLIYAVAPVRSLLTRLWNRLSKSKFLIKTDQTKVHPDPRLPQGDLPSPAYNLAGVVLFKSGFAYAALPTAVSFCVIHLLFCFRITADPFLSAVPAASILSIIKIN